MIQKYSLFFLMLSDIDELVNVAVGQNMKV